MEKKTDKKVDEAQQKYYPTPLTKLHFRLQRQFNHI